MSENNYVERGSIKITNNIEKAQIAHPNDPTKRRLKLQVTSGGNLRGFVQPEGHGEEIKLKAIKKQLQAGNYEPETPDYAEFGYVEKNDPKTGQPYVTEHGEIRSFPTFTYKDVTMSDGSPLTMSPGEVILFNHLDELQGKPIEKGERAAFSGWATDLKGNLTQPSAWRREKDGEIFYSGTNEDFDLAQYLEAKGVKKSKDITD